MNIENRLRVVLVIVIIFSFNSSGQNRVFNTELNLLKVKNKGLLNVLDYSMTFHKKFDTSFTKKIGYLIIGEFGTGIMLAVEYYSDKPGLLDSTWSILGYFTYKNHPFYVVLGGDNLNVCLIGEIFKITSSKIKFNFKNYKFVDKGTTLVYIYYDLEFHLFSID